MTIQAAFNEITEDLGGTPSTDGTIAGAIDALNDTLAGSNQERGNSIEDAVRLLGEHIGGAPSLFPVSIEIDNTISNVLITDIEEDVDIEPEFDGLTASVLLEAGKIYTIEAQTSSSPLQIEVLLISEIWPSPGLNALISQNPKTFIMPNNDSIKIVIQGNQK